MSIIDRPALDAKADRYEPSEADLAEYSVWLAATDAEHHDQDAEVPVECYREPWASWPGWTDERFTLAEDPEDELTYQRRPVPLTDADADHYRHLNRYA